MCRLCGIVGGPMPLRLVDAEIADEVEQPMAVKLRQECLRDFQSVALRRIAPYKKNV